DASARWFSQIMDLPCEGTSVQLNQTQVLQFVPRERHSGQGGERHFCFRVGDREFDLILSRVRGEGIKVRPDPGGPGHGPRVESDEINYYHNGRGFYFSSPEGHGYEVITQPYVRGMGGHHEPQPA